MDELDLIWMNLHNAQVRGEITWDQMTACYRANCDRVLAERGAKARRMRLERERNDKRNNRADRLRAFGTYAPRA